MKKYSEALTALVMFVADLAKNSDDIIQRDKASEIMADFILAALIDRKPKTLEELEAENPDGFRNN